MDDETVRRHIATQRRELADLIEALDAGEPGCWSTPSLCAGWSVRDVAAHLTHATLPAPRMVIEAARSGFRFDTVVDRMARADRRAPAHIAAALRADAESRRRPPGTSVMEPLIDLLVHGQDLCVPLGIDRPMPDDAAVAAAHRVWRMGFPFRARRRMAGLRLVATDAAFEVGEGRAHRAPIRELLMQMTGRATAAG
ncbi:maleylpyruvate isomerase family mycothiol-dependent enzyme [Mycolicibacterium sp. 018/SC-01/001]|uniref:maleylpyruvate isomerase family mycothiol-dependent enzyme n=1 Tax=Mycolicibacterium sp. 018/SC-01/001 TaxID=2592069 RepID=UPI00117C50E3|nr:maleylpyruvate isomerase family mycothiol-dependent enzyme [Mycolicibacterium sp. 018/SC-01/001]TRW77537.1 maleylpyruvate isomerase family mycothiol-dependent enzyme [Mycolicibacterium sp. 018/SC-01/001]